MSTLLLSMIVFFFYCYRTHRDLHSFPTRRSSDLDWLIAAIDSRGQGEIKLVRPGQIVGHILRWHRSEEHTSELQSHSDLVCRLLLEKKKIRRPRDMAAQSGQRNCGDHLAPRIR